MGLICPAAQGSEAAWAGQVQVLAVPDLLALLSHLKGTRLLRPPEPGEAEPLGSGPDLRQVKGQEIAKRALEIAAAGGHNLLMSGPPGAGKSLLASCLPGILPPFEPAEALEVSMVASVAGELESGRLRRRRPFRTPHHSASMPALVGGGLKVRPGEISLAHLGVLFLDELPEFQRAVLDSLRQPLETGAVTVVRANMHVTFPARVQMVAAMNPCRCGHLGDPALACARAPRCAADYQARVSGPLLDRLDLHVDVQGVSAADLTLPLPRRGASKWRSGSRWPAPCRPSATRGMASAPTPKWTATCLTQSRHPTIPAASCLPTLRQRCACPPAAFIAYCASPGRSLTSRGPSRSVGSISPKRSTIVASRHATDREIPPIDSVAGHG